MLDLNKSTPPPLPTLRWSPPLSEKAPLARFQCVASKDGWLVLIKPTNTGRPGFLVRLFNPITGASLPCIISRLRTSVRSSSLLPLEKKTPASSFCSTMPLNWPWCKPTIDGNWVFPTIANFELNLWRTPPTLQANFTSSTASATTGKSTLLITQPAPPPQSHRSHSLRSKYYQNDVFWRWHINDCGIFTLDDQKLQRFSPTKQRSQLFFWFLPMPLRINNADEKLDHPVSHEKMILIMTKMNNMMGMSK
uniref:Uncharacterized protein n=1 Tax=Linum usitatissimum TaxID=4006 RepID=A0A172MLF0_LINUS|nr:hypothetical protein [Linum usitatissimum]